MLSAQQLSTGLKRVSESFIVDRTGKSINKDNIKGSPYSDENFKMAKITPLNEKYLVRYNAVQDEIEVKTKEGNLLLLEKKSNYTVELQNKTYKTFNYNPNSNNTELVFFVVGSEFKNLSILKRETKKFHEEKKGVTSYHADKPAYYDDKYKTQLFIKFVIKKYIKDNKISLKKEDQLLKLLKHINTLLETE